MWLWVEGVISLMDSLVTEIGVCSRKIRLIVALSWFGVVAFDLGMRILSLPYEPIFLFNQIKFSIFF